MTENKFQLRYYDEIIRKAKDAGYTFKTMREFAAGGFYPSKTVILRHDLDAYPKTLEKMLMAEEANGVRSTVFVRVTGKYNIFNYETYPVLKMAERVGAEIGLHTNALEFARIHGEEPMEQLVRELTVLQMATKNSIRGVACHRDMNFTWNCLPWLQEKWDHIKQITGLEYEAYEEGFSRVAYVNEGLKPHLCWRGRSPEEVIETGDSFVMLTHSHWWFDKHPFEAWQL